MSCCNPGYCDCDSKDRDRTDLIVNELEKIVSLTHSWVIAEKTQDCKHTYAEIRQVVNRLKELL